MKEFSIFLLLLAILFSVACWGLSPTNRQTHPIGYNVTMIEKNQNDFTPIEVLK